MRGATNGLFWKGAYYGISTHTPLAGCNYRMCVKNCTGRDFYSHTPHGVQPNQISTLMHYERFLLTHPSRGATFGCCCAVVIWQISTHTPLTGCNLRNNFRNFKFYRFLLTHPSRGATSGILTIGRTRQFLLTHPSRGATNQLIMFQI